MAYVKFGYSPAADQEISADGEFLATLGFTWKQLSNEHDPKLTQAFKAARLEENPKWENPHSGNSWGNVVNVACVLVKHGWKTISEIPTDHPLRGRVVDGALPENPVYKSIVE